jgi:hypothetical protein
MENIRLISYLAQDTGAATIPDILVSQIGPALNYYGLLVQIERRSG